MRYILLFAFQNRCYYIHGFVNERFRMACHVACSEETFRCRSCRRKNRIYINTRLINFLCFFKSIKRVICINRNYRCFGHSYAYALRYEALTCVCRDMRKIINNFGMLFQIAQCGKRNSTACRSY